MNWIDIVSILFACVTANHLGLVTAIEYVTKRELPVINCPKCLTFWCVLAYWLLFVGLTDVPLMLAVSFLSSYAALWLELAEGYIDKLYMRLYEKIYNTTADKTATDTDNGHPTGTMS